jgi:hypothetical protein
MLFEKKIAVYYENHTKNTNVIYGQSTDLCNVNADGA